MPSLFADRRLVYNSTHNSLQPCVSYDSTCIAATSGTGTNLKVGGKGTGRSESGGHRSDAKRRNNFFGVVPLHFFGTKSTISRFGERFCDGQYSFVSFLFAVLLLTLPPCPAICKSGGHVPPCLHGVGATGCNPVYL